MSLRSALIRFNETENVVLAIVIDTLETPSETVELPGKDAQASVVIFPVD